MSPPRDDRSRVEGDDPPLIFTPEYYARMRDLEESGWWNAGMRSAAARLIGRAGLPGSGRMLDVGCGSAQTLRWLGSLLPGWRANGIDVALDGLRAGVASGTPGLAAASALALPFPSASMDLVVTLDVLQHVPLPDGDQVALAEIRRVLKKGGVLFVRTNAQAFPVTPDDVEHSFHRYEPAELHGKLERAGLKVDRLSRINALLGLAEIPRELRAGQASGSYHGIMARPNRGSDPLRALKRGWLSLEGWAVAKGVRLPIGRTILALCRAV